jgi:hypothetical protein
MITGTDFHLLLTPRQQQPASQQARLSGLACWSYIFKFKFKLLVILPGRQLELYKYILFESGNVDNSGNKVAACAVALRHIAFQQQSLQWKWLKCSKSPSIIILQLVY